MLIEFLRRPSKPTRTVECFGKKYVFKEIIPGRWVAEVDDPKAAKALTDTGAYREFTDTLPISTLAAPTPAPAAPPATPAPPPAPVVASTPVVTAPADQTHTPTDAGGGTAGGQGDGAPAQEDKATAPPPADAALEDAAKELLAGVPTQVRKAAKSAAPDVLSRALAIEQAQEKPRPSVVALLQELVQG